MHCNLRPPDATPVFSALITTPCQVWSRWTYPLPYYRVFAAHTVFNAANLTFDPATLTFEHWPWTFTMYRLWRAETLYQIWTQSINPRRSYYDFNIWPNDLERCVTHWNWVMLKTTPNFARFDPLPVKIEEGVGEISIPLVEALPTSEPPEYIWWPSTAWLLSAVDW